MRVIVFTVSIFLFACGSSSRPKIVSINGVTTKTIPGITASDIHGNFTNKGFVLKKNIGTDFSSWTCSYFGYMKEFIVIASGASVSEITNVDVGATFDKDLDKETIEFLGYGASLTYLKSNPVFAKKWVMENVEKSGDTTIGDVHFRLISSPNAISLKMYVD